MINLSKKEFQEFKKLGIGFSVISDFRGDEITPIKIYNGLKGKNKFIFESGSREGHFGRYSYIGENPIKEILGHSLNEIAELRQDINIEFINNNKFTYKGGAIGYFGYDTIALFEKKLNFRNIDELEIPAIRFNFYNRYICYDHFTHKVYIVDNVFPEDERSFEKIMYSQEEYLKEILNQVNELTKEDEEELSFIFNISKEEFIKRVEIAKQYIEEGDIFQVVLSQRMKCKTKKNPLEIYRRLREENPSSYMFLINYDNYQVIGSSPESLVSLTGTSITTNPIAGTRKRGETTKEDLVLEKELINDEKELAEHVMLVDLGRNDIGRVSKIGTVDVKDFMQVERYSHVMHITTKLTGEIIQGKDGFDGLISCLPAGTVSGAPKIRAMEIIEELEEYKRGIYAGAIGYFSYGGDMDMCIAIRSLIVKDGVAYSQAGAGIVYDSIPEKEYEEVQNKLKVIKEVLK